MYLTSTILITIGVYLLYYSRKRRLHFIKNSIEWKGIVTESKMIDMGHMEDRLSGYRYSYVIDGRKYSGDAFGKHRVDDVVLILVSSVEYSESVVLKDLKSSGFIFISRLLGVFISAIGLIFLTVALVSKSD